MRPSRRSWRRERHDDPARLVAAIEALRAAGHEVEQAAGLYVVDGRELTEMQVMEAAREILEDDDAD